MNNRYLTNFDRFAHELRNELSRHWVGFDSIFDGVRNTINDYQTYPPYNVVKLNETAYLITLAVAGFTSNDLEVMKEGDLLIVAGKAADNEVTYLHRGIATRAFTRKIQLASDIEVIGAKLENGLLHVELEKVIPESEKPQRIEIK